MEFAMQTVYCFINQMFYTAVHENIGLQTVCNIINTISKGNNTEDISNTELTRNNEEKELKKKDEIVHSENIQGNKGDKSIEEIIIGNKNSKQNQSSKKFATIKQTLDISSLKTQNTDLVLITNKKSRKKQKSENTLNETTNNSPPRESYLFSQYTQPKSVKNKKKRKLKSSMTHSNKAKDSVQSLPGSSALSKKPSYIEATKTNLNKAACGPAVAVPKQTTSPVSIPTPKENGTAVKLLGKKEKWVGPGLPGLPAGYATGTSNKAKDSVQSLPGSSALSKKPSYIEATKTNLNKVACGPAVAVPKQTTSPVSIPTTKENNTAVKLLGKKGTSNKAKDSVQSLPGSSALSKKPSYIEATKTNLNKAACGPAVAVPKQTTSPVSIPTPKENDTAVKLLSKKGTSNKAKDSVQSLPGSSALSKKPLYIEATKTNLNKAACGPAVAVPKQTTSPVSIPTTIENTKAVELLGEQGHFNKAKDSVQSLSGSSALTKQPSYIEAFKTNLNKAACGPAVAVSKQRASPVSIPSLIIYNTEVKLFCKQGTSNKAKDSVQSLPGSSALSKKPSYLEATKTNLNKAACVLAVPVPNEGAPPISTPTTIENNKAVELLGEQGTSNKAKESVQSLPGSSALSKKPSYIEATKTNLNKAACGPAVAVPKQTTSPVSIPTPKENDTAVKLLGKNGHFNKARDSVQSLSGSSALTKQPSYIEAFKTNLNKPACVPAVAVSKQRAYPVSIPSLIIYNTEVKLLGKQGTSNKAKDSLQSSPGLAALSKKPSYLEATKTNLNKAACVPAVPVPNQGASTVSTPTTKENNTAVELLGEQEILILNNYASTSNKANDSVQSLPGSSALSKKPSYLEATKTNLNKAACVLAVPVPNQGAPPISTPTTIENNKAVELLGEQGTSNKTKDSVQSLPESSPLSKKPSYIEATKTNLNKAACGPAVAVPKQTTSPVSIPTTKENDTAVKLLDNKGTSNKAKDSVQSLPGSSALSKKPSYIEATKTNLNKAACGPAVAVPKQTTSPVSIPTPKENDTAVKLLGKKGTSNKTKDSVQSLPGSSALSKKPSYIEATKSNLDKAACGPAVAVPKQTTSPVSIPTPKENGTAVKLLGKKGTSNKTKDSVQSLPGSSALSKKPSYIEATEANLNKAACGPAVAVPKQTTSPVSIPTPKENDTAVKLLGKKGTSNKANDSVQSLPGSSALSKKPSYLEATKTNLNKAACVLAVPVPNQGAPPISTPTTIENNKAVELLGEQGTSNKTKDSVQSLPESSALSKKPSYIEATKTNLNKAACGPAVAVPKQTTSPVSIPTPKENDTAVKLLGKKGTSNKTKDSVQSLPGSSALSKKPSYIEATKTNLNKAACGPAVAVSKQRASPVSIPSLIICNTEVTLLGKQGHSNKAEDFVQSLLGSSALSKQPAYIEVPKTNLNKAVSVSAVAVSKQRATSPVSIPTTLPNPVEYNSKEVILFVNQAWQDVEKEKINGRLNILECKRE